MSTALLPRAPLRPSVAITSARAISPTQCRHASLIRRPKRPYTFTQLITLSDGSTFLHRTTSPAPIYKSTKDMRNTPLWNPSSQKLLNLEEDEAGKLKAFRARFGRGWDAETVGAGEEARTGEEGLPPSEAEDSMLDLIAEYGRSQEGKGKAAGKREKAVSGKEGKGSK